MGEGAEGFLKVSGDLSDGVSSMCVPLSLMGRTWDREEGRVSYELTRWFSSRDGIGGDDKEDGGEKSSVSRLWWMRFQSYSAI